MSLLYTSTCFEQNCAHHQEVKIVLYSIWYRHTLPAGCDDTKFLLLAKFIKND